MKSEKWLLLHRDSTIRENIRIRNAYNEYMAEVYAGASDGSDIEPTDEQKATLDAMDRAIYQNDMVINFIGFVLQDDDQSEYTEDVMTKDILDQIFKFRPEFQSKSEDYLKTVYTFNLLRDIAPEELIESLKPAAVEYCKEYGADFGIGDGIVQIIRYKSELRNEPPAPEKEAGESEETAPKTPAPKSKKAKGKV